MYTDINKRPVYDNTQVSFYMEFFSPMDRGTLATKLSKFTRKSVKYSNSFAANENKIKGRELMLVPNFMGGQMLNRIQTGFLPYNEGLNTALNILNFIGEFGHTTQKCKMGVGIKMDSAKLNIPKISEINVFKMMLNIDEGFIFEKWGKNSDRMYRSSVSYIYPKNIFLGDIDINTLSRLGSNGFRYPVSNYFGIDLKQLSENLFKMKYIGGKNYENSKIEIISFINETIEKLHYVLENNHNYSDTEKSQISRVLIEQKRIIGSIKNYSTLKMNYPGIEVLVDLKENIDYLRGIKYNDIKDKIFELLAYGHVKNGIINYDSSRNSFQIKDAKLYNAFFINGVEFFDSIVEGDLSDCKFYTCKIGNSKLENCEIFSNNEIRNSTLLECAYHGLNNEVKNSYLKNSPELLIEARVINSVIRKGTLAYSSEIDELTELVDVKYNQ